MTTVPTAACAACYIGAASTVLHSFPYTIDTVTVEVIPQVTVVPHVTTVTYYDRETQTSHDSLLASAVTTYSNLSAMTWTVADATLTYPTTYAEYLSIQGATPRGAQTCAQSSSTFALAIPSSAPNFYPLDSVQDSGGLPLKLLEYLQFQPEISAQFSSYPLTACGAFPQATDAIEIDATTEQRLQMGEDISGPQPTIAPLLHGQMEHGHKQKKTHKPAVVITVITRMPVVKTKEAP